MKAPNGTSDVNPTNRSATAKLMTRKEVRLRLLRFFQNTNMVKMLPTMMIKDSSMAAYKTTIIAVLHMIGALNWPGTHKPKDFSLSCIKFSLAGLQSEKPLPS